MLEHALQIGNTAKDAKFAPAVREMVSVGDEAEDFVAPIFVLFDHSREIGGATARSDDEQRAIVETFRSDIARDHAQHDLLEHEEERRERAEENEPRAR